jgi:lantibiotic modifying enzyme
MNKEEIENIIRGIANDCLENSDEINKKIDFANGSAGVAIFLGLASKYFENENYKEKSIEFISNCLEKIPKIDYELEGTFFNGLSGIVWSILFLNKNNIIEIDENSFFEEFDLYIEKFLINSIEKGEYDLLHGYLGIGLYLLEKPDNSNSLMLLEKIFDALKQNAIECEDGIKWNDYWGLKYATDKKSKIYNFGMAHGIPSIIIFLVKLYEKNIRKNEIERLIYGAINYLLANKNDESHFCSFSTAKTEFLPINNDSRLGWCYGDTGPAIAILKAGIVFEKEEWISESKIIIDKIVSNRDVNNSLIRDANFCHGSLGIAHMFSRINAYFKKEEFSNYEKYWFNIFFDKQYQEQRLSVYYKRDGSNEATYINDYGLLIGKSGMGLILLSQLDSELSNWDYPFLIQL